MTTTTITLYVLLFILVITGIIVWAIIIMAFISISILSIQNSNTWKKVKNWRWITNGGNKNE